MKRNDWKIIIGSIAFTYLFYEQEVGINFLFFAIIASVFLLLNKPEHLFKPSVIASLVGTLISAIFVFIYGTSLPVISFIISISFLSALVFEPESSLILSGLQGFANVLLSMPRMIIDLLSSKPEDSLKKNRFTKMFLLTIPLFITLIFFLLYRIANPNFLEFTKDLNFDWINLPLVRFLILAIFLMYGLLSDKIFKVLQAKDLLKSDEVQTTTEELHLQGGIGKRLGIEYEIFIGASLLIMLNILLAVVNGIDLVKLWPNPILPGDQDSFSQYLHNGVQMLILSILFAVGILMFFFRGYFNFFKGAIYLRILGYVWIVQNIILLISTAIRNNIYVEAYGLSHKRIGVFIYLLLAGIGLSITFYKLFAKKNNTFLFRKNSWAFYAVLLIATTIPWDQLITNYNMSLAVKQNKAVDYEYLARLSHTNIGQIIPQLKLKQHELFIGDGLELESSFYLNDKLVRFLRDTQQEAWPSFCLSRQQNLRIISELNEEGKVPAIVLNETDVSIKSLTKLSNLKSLVIKNPRDIEDWSSLDQFTQLELLNTQNTYFNSLDSLPKLPKLKYLNMEYNYIYALDKIALYPNLEYLNLRGNDILSYRGLYNLKKLKKLFIDDLGEEARIELERQLPNTEIIYTIDSSKSY